MHARVKQIEYELMLHRFAFALIIIATLISILER